MSIFIFRIKSAIHIGVKASLSQSQDISLTILMTQLPVWNKIQIPQARQSLGSFMNFFFYFSQNDSQRHNAAAFEE